MNTGSPAPSGGSDKGKVPLKRSKWDRDDDEDDLADELERQAIEARAKAAAKAARQRAKAAQRARADQMKLEEQQDETVTSTSTPRTIGSSSNSAGPSTPLRQMNLAAHHTAAPTSQSRRPPVPPRSRYPSIQGCRSIHEYERLNHIEEGSYGVVFRAREKATGDIVALKKLKMDKEKNGFPITSLREIRSLMEASHENVVRVREIVVGDTLTQ